LSALICQTSGYGKTGTCSFICQTGLKIASFIHREQNKGDKMKKLIIILILLIGLTAIANAQTTIFSGDLTTSFKINDREIRNLNGTINYEYGWDYATGSFGLNSTFYSGFHEYGTDATGSISTGEEKTSHETSADPEPTTLILIGIGLSGLAIRKKFSK
jgi:hypothetical protein